MTTPVATITAAVVAALQTAPAVAPQVARVRLRPFTDATTTAVAVRPLGATRNDEVLDDQGVDSWLIRFSVECYARSATGTSPDVPLDTLLQAVLNRLMAAPTLGGAAPNGITPVSVNFDFDADGDQFGAAVLQFETLVDTGPTFN